MSTRFSICKNLILLSQIWYWYASQLWIKTNLWIFCKTSITLPFPFTCSSYLPPTSLPPPYLPPAYVDQIKSCVSEVNISQTTWIKCYTTAGVSGTHQKWKQTQLINPISSSLLSHTFDLSLGLRPVLGHSVSMLNEVHGDWAMMSSWESAVWF